MYIENVYRRVQIEMFIELTYFSELFSISIKEEFPCPL